MTTCPVCNSAVSPGDAACPSCGFKLSGSTQQFEPIAMPGAQRAQADPAPARAAASLRVVRGPQQIDTVYELEPRQMTIGRSPACDIFLNDMTVSRSHALVMPVGERFAVQDDGSFNGVWVNNGNVSQHVLHDGDIVQIGSFCLLFRE